SASRAASAARRNWLEGVGRQDLWNVPRRGRNQSAFAPESLTTLAHFSVSLAKSLAKSAGEPGSGVPPSSVIRAFILGSVKPALSSRLSLSTIAVGVPTGAAIPYHALAS